MIEISVGARGCVCEVNGRMVDEKMHRVLKRLRSVGVFFSISIGKMNYEKCFLAVHGILKQQIEIRK